MVTYEYDCTKCGERVEIKKKMTAPTPRTHRGCGGNLKRVWSAPSIAFRGPGFYSTDNR